MKPPSLYATFLKNNEPETEAELGKVSPPNLVKVPADGILHRVILISTLCAMIFLPQSLSAQSAGSYYKEGKALMEQGRYGEAVKAFEQAVNKHPIASYWRALADAYVADGQFGKAPYAYRKAAVIYRKIGDPNAAKVLEIQADRYDTEVMLFYQRKARRSRLERYYTGRRLEPLYGTYIGAFLDREDAISGEFLDENWQKHKDVGEFARLVGKKHAIFFMYLSYGQDFPTQWTNHLKENGAAAHIAFEPKDISQVRDDGYLRGFARKAKESGIPVFIRFAGEMNGAWTPYHKDPDLYIQKFRLVADVFHQEAPNVAMVWCVNDIPEHNITRYYPGENYVDWVGVNFYSVLYNDNNPNRPAEWKNPADSLKFVYRTYANKHPIMIGEYAATHFSEVDKRPRPDFAINKIAQLYSALPRLYPRVKAVHWLSMNTMKYARPGRQLNNYSLLENLQIRKQYSAMISSSYFLTKVSLNKPAVAPEEVVELKEGAKLSGKVRLSAWVKGYEERPKVVYFLNGQKRKTFSVPSDYAWELDTTAYPDTEAQINIVVYDRQGRVAGRQAIHVFFANGR